MANPAVTDRLDGRTLRRDRNRDAVLDAVIELYREGNLSPRLEEAAARAGVSLRSVYRYFPEPADLLGAAVIRDFERASKDFTCVAGAKGTLQQRIEAYVDNRLQLYEAFAPSCRVARVHADSYPELAAILRAARDLVSDHVRAYFGPELSECLRSARTR